LAGGQRDFAFQQRSGCQHGEAAAVEQAALPRCQRSDAMTLPTALPMTRRGALAAALAAAAWRPAFAQDTAGQAEALHALNRLAFGPAPGDLERVTRLGATAWIAEQLHPERLTLPSFLADQLATLRTPGQTQRELVRDYREAAKAAKQARQAETAAPDGTKPRSEEAAERRRQAAAIVVEAGEQRLLQALNSPRQLQEVLVDFWFNHFNVFQGKGLDRVLVESYEREAIRPNVFGRFRTMLGATAKHPAMLFYLDNWLSVAPGFQPPARLFAATRPAAGLNENYAREVMELHTLGVDGGYTQRDVTELARILTGWTMAPQPPKRRHVDLTSGPVYARGQPQGDSIFVFDPARHDDGPKTWLGHAVAPGGQAEGEFALDALARHPATAKHVASRLARRFVADDPPPALVARLSQRFLGTDGDLRAVMQALVDSPEFRDPRAVKFKTPYQYVMSSVRATGIVASNVKPLMAQLAQLGQPLYGCQTPDGWHDTEADWLGPDAITQRVNFATVLASGRLPLQRVDDPDSPVPAPGLKAMERQADKATARDQPVEGSTPPVDAATLLAALGPAISDKTRAAVASSPPALRAALVLGSPDFMRR
jgi:uncharacterized protein (DUF1800 family)